MSKREAIETRYPLASCVECGQVVFLSVGTKMTTMHDPSNDWREAVLEFVGWEALIRQGLGPGNGSSHRCPWEPPASA